MATIPPEYPQETIDEAWENWRAQHPEESDLRRAFEGGYVDGSRYRRIFQKTRLSFSNPEGIREFIRLYSAKRPTGCWEWTRGKRGGYGSLVVDGKTHRLTRVSKHVFSGFDLNSPLFMCHTCDNPPCCNPEHLFPGTHRENMLDKVRKGRCNVANNGRRKMSAEMAWSIRKLYRMGFQKEILGKMYGMTSIGVGSIISKRTWWRLADRNDLYPYIDWNFRPQPKRYQRGTPRHGHWKTYQKHNCHCGLCKTSVSIRRKLRRLKVTSSFLGRQPGTESVTNDTELSKNLEFRAAA